MAKRGRPPFKPTAAMRRKVAAATAGGIPQESIALAIGCTAPTLRKHFANELTIGAAAQRVDAMDALFRKAKGGNVAACKAVLVLQAARAPVGVTPKAQGASAPAAAPAPKPLKLGKKEQAQHDAGAAAQGTPWENTLPTFTGGSTPVQ